MPRVVHFEITVDDADRAVRFYSEVFGWNFRLWEGPQPYWLIQTGPKEEPGIDGGLMNRQGSGITGAINTIDVPSLDEAVERITANGGSVVEPKMAVPGVGYLAYCLDTEGNMFGLMQADRNAA